MFENEQERKIAHPFPSFDEKKRSFGCFSTIPSILRNLFLVWGASQNPKKKISRVFFLINFFSSPKTFIKKNGGID